MDPWSCAATCWAPMRGRGCTLGGADTIEAAAAGDRAASRKLLAHERYYGGRARDSLSVLLPLDPKETRTRLSHALEVGSRLLVSAQAEALSRRCSTSYHDTRIRSARWRRSSRSPRAIAMSRSRRPSACCSSPTSSPSRGSYSPSTAATRLIVYQARAERGADERVAALGRALADPKRVEILSLVSRGADRVSELVAQTGLARSTVHHHLGELRDARLIDLEGNARAYRYRPRHEALEETLALLSEVLPRA